MLALAYFSVSIGLATDKYTIHCVNAIPEDGHYVSQRYQFVVPNSSFSDHLSRWLPDYKYNAASVLGDPGYLEIPSMKSKYKLGDSF